MEGQARMHQRVRLYMTGILAYTEGLLCDVFLHNQHSFNLLLQVFLPVWLHHTKKNGAEMQDGNPRMQARIYRRESVRQVDKHLILCNSKVWRASSWCFSVKT